MLHDPLNLTRNRTRRCSFNTYLFENKLNTNIEITKAEAKDKKLEDMVVAEI